MYPQYNINLLPKKEKKNIFAALLLLVFVVIGAAISLYIYLSINELTIEKETVQRELTILQTELEAISKETVANSTAVDVQQLKDQVQIFESNPAHSVKLLEEITKLLPERGFITSYSYTQYETVTLSVQFDLYREAAYFQKRLQEKDWVTSVTLSNINSSQLEEQLTDDSMPRYVAQFTIIYDSTPWIEGKEAGE